MDMEKRVYEYIGGMGRSGLCFFLACFSFVFAQFNRLGINPDNLPAHSSAILDVDVGSGPAKGVLIPRLSDGERDQLAAVEGLLIFNTTTNHLNYFDGVQWVQVDTVQVTGVFPPAGTNGGYGVAISPTGVSPHDAALLDVFGTTGGLLLPRLTTAQRDAISTPAEGLLIYNTDTKRLNYYDGTGWKEFCNTTVVSTATGGVTAVDGICVSTSGAVRNPVAILEINGTEGGFLLPRVTTAGRDTIKNPLVGLIIYNTSTKRIEMYGGGDKWITMDGFSSCVPPSLACFDSTYGGTGEDDEPYGIVQMSDGSYYVAGYSKSFSGGDQDVWLLKLDANGKVLWTKVYPIPSSNDFVQGMIHTSDNSLLISGYSGSFGNYDILLIKVQLDGTVVWAKKYNIGSNDYGRSVVEDGNGDYIVAFRTNQSSNYDVGLLKVNAADGFVIWAKSYYPTGGTYGEWIWELALIPPTNYVLGAYTGPGGTNPDPYDVWVISVDGSGNVSWNTKLSGGLGDRVYSIKKTPSGDFILGGTTYSTSANNRLIAVKLDGSTGNLIWEKQYSDDIAVGGTNDTTYLAYGIINTSDGGHLLVGYIRSFANSLERDLLAVKIDSIGNLLWAKRFGDNSSTYIENAYKAIVTQDNKILITALNQSLNSGNGGEFWILKMDNNGNGPSCFGNLNLYTTSSGFIPSSLSVSSSNLTLSVSENTVSITPQGATPDQAGCGCP